MDNRDMIERAKMIVCMEYICRHINHDGIFNSWLMGGIPDGEIKYGDLDYNNVDECFIEDDDFKDLMSCFLRKMNSAYKNGGLYCGHITSDCLAMED